MTPGWRGRRTNASQPRSEGGSRLSEIDISGISRNHPKMVFGSKVRRWLLLIRICRDSSIICWSLMRTRSTQVEAG